MATIHKCQDEGKKYEENELIKKMAFVFKNQILEHFKVNKNSNILDFGAGTGLIGMEFLPISKHVTFVDGSEKMIEYLKEKLEKLEYKNYDVILTKDSTFSSSHTYDIIICANVVHHIEDLSSLFSNLLNILNPGGKLCISDFYTNIPFFSNPGHNMPHKGFEPIELKKILEENGFSNIEIIDTEPYRRKREDGTESYGRRFGIFAVKNIK